MSRLGIDLTEQQHQNLKALALLEGKSIRQYAIERLLPGHADLAWQELKVLLTSRINDALAGKVSTKTIREIVAEELAQGS
ncbi:MAG: antitoxin [Alphaproteobacteria bacterium]|nr:antitoxin [Alphaproteobacteria bacterium]